MKNICLFAVGLIMAFQFCLVQGQSNKNNQLPHLKKNGAVTQLIPCRGIAQFEFIQPGIYEAYLAQAKGHEPEHCTVSCILADGGKGRRQI